ncbi:hypothetical protein PEBR_18902 [Penicillium brasilianum]|uniref:Zn(2)-C6 fungal-type domain-containing protein n=1 Tax=Penicillium brasilianum TaxID=104259 RepID=A0A1S9RNC5_PENBI|nr:hypothetical protein PEBR_18902 [Penicillium brasilianum]
MPTRRESPNCPVACLYCRAKKAKCNGLKPCGNCIVHNESCTFPEVQPRARKRKRREDELEDRLRQMEVMLREATEGQKSNQNISRDVYQDGHAPIAGASEPVSPPPNEDQQPASLGVHVNPAMNEKNVATTTVNDTAVGPGGTVIHGSYEAISPPTPRLQNQMLNSGDLSFSSQVQEAASSELDQDRPHNDIPTAEYGTLPVTASCLSPITIACAPVRSGEQSRKDPWVMPSSAAGKVHFFQSKLPDDDETSDLKGKESMSPPIYALYIILILQKELDRYLSLCPVPAVEWVSSQINTPELTAGSTPLSTDVIIRGEPLEQSLERTRAPEPNSETAFQWADAYFKSHIDAVFGILDRTAFEARLRAHFKQNEPSSCDKSWYALRNVVYAAGCRFVLSQDSGSNGFAKARSQSWRYYQNALSVHTDLLYMCDNLTSIRALILMAFFSEAVGNPRLEYMLVSGAVRLAQSLGLHLRSSYRPETPSTGASSRQKLWWSLYAYEKQLACRCGRPSAIDDDYISCPIPSSLKDGHSEDLEFIIKAAQHAQISSDIARHLNSAKAMRDAPQSTMRHMQTLEARLVAWQQSLDPIYKTRAPFNSLPLQDTQLFRMLFFHFSYLVSVITIHGSFCYPWDRPDLQSAKGSEIRAQMRKSTEAVGQASRQIILGLQRLETMFTLPLWLTFYYPLVGLVNLLVYVLKDPKGSSVAADVSLMDTVVGDITFRMRRFIEEANKMQLEEGLPTQSGSMATVPDGDLPLDIAKLNWASCMPLLADVSNMDNQILGWEDMFPFLPSVTESVPFVSNSNNSRGDDMGLMAHDF